MTKKSAELQLVALHLGETRAVRIGRFQYLSQTRMKHTPASKTVPILWPELKFHSMRELMCSPCWFIFHTTQEISELLLSSERQREITWLRMHGHRPHDDRDTPPSSSACQ